MNVLKSFKQKQEPVMTVYVKSLTVVNPYKIVILTSHMDIGYSNNNINSLKLNMVNDKGEQVSLSGVGKVSTVRRFENTIRHNDMFLDRGMRLREVTITLLNRLNMNDINSIVKMFNTQVDIEHYSFEQEFNSLWLKN